MAYLSSEMITILEKRLTNLEAQIETANTTFTSIIGETLASYRMDTSEGSVRGDRWKIDEMIKQIDIMERMADSIRRRLGNLSNVNLNVRRK
jgi:uncharacterized protein Yka (UPF0111/DUF47 family)